MWFKSVLPFKLDDDFECKAESLAEHLEKNLFQPCSAYSMSSAGWFPPMGTPEAPLVHASGSFMMIALKVQDKILPAASIKEALDERCYALLAQDGVMPKGRAKQRLKDEIINVMMPKALTKSALMHGIIDMKDKMLWINTTSATKADMFLSSLREVLGSLPATKPQFDSPSDIMTSWLSRGYVPENFEIEDACMMVDPNIEGGTIRCKKQDLQSQNIQSFIRDGCRIQQMSMKWQEQVSFVLCHDFSLKALRFLDAVKDAVDDVAAESPEQQFDADFFIMTEALQHLLAALASALGTEEIQEASKEPELVEA